MSEVTSTYMAGQKLADSWTIYPEVGSYTVTTEDSTSIQVAFGGTEQRRVGQWPLGGRTHFAFRTMELTQVQAQEFRDFLQTLRGAGNPFYFFDFTKDYYYRVNVGTADGTANLQIPFLLDATPTEVRDDGVALSSWSFTSQYGTGRESRLTSLNPVPGNGSVMTATFYGRKRYICRMESDRLPRGLMAGGETATPYWQFDMSVVQVL